MSGLTSEFTDEHAAALLDRLASYFEAYPAGGDPGSMTVAELASDLWDTISDQRFASPARGARLYHQGLI